ncbi:hypothetical protein ACWC3X_38455 [Streptomyces populi]
MTRRPKRNRDDQAAHHWLTQHQHTLTHALDDLLDTEAGLREILLHSHHDTATDNLDTVLDTEAGLAAILPTPQPSPAGAPDTPHHHTAMPDLLRVLSPAERMALRNNSNVRTASQALARALARTRPLVGDLRLALEFTRDLGSDLAEAAVHDLDRARVRPRTLKLARDLTSFFDPSRARATVGERARARADEFASQLASELAGDRKRARARARVIDLNRDLDLDRARVIDLAWVRVMDLIRVLGLERDLARDPEWEPDRIRDLAHDLARAYGIVAEIRAAEVGRAIGQALRREPLVVDEDSLTVLLDDFTTTDLSDVDLTGIDLSGVRWSEHTTQWPPVIDIEDLKARSVQAPPYNGIWIVRSGTATIRDLAER